MEIAGLVERIEGPAEGIGGLGRLDLRRRCEREQAERVLGRASFLPRRDELLLRAVLEDGIAVTELARLSGVCPRAMRGRVKRLLRRMSTPRFVFVAARIGEWTATRRKVAEACYLHGLSMREARERLGLSPHQVRFHRDAVEALFQMEVARARREAEAGGTGACAERDGVAAQGDRLGDRLGNQLGNQLGASRQEAA